MKKKAQWNQCLERARLIVAAYRSDCPEGCDPQNTFAAIAIGVGVAGVGLSAYGASQSGGTPQTAKPQLFQPQLLKQPLAQVNLGQVQSDYLNTLSTSMPQAEGIAGSVNNFNINQALSAYTKFQPEFTDLQKQIGENALSYSKGQLPADTVQSIQRAAASQGQAGGIAGGSTGPAFGGGNSEMGNLNLRNLGLTSLDLSEMGTNLGMQVNAQAKALSPVLASPTDFEPNFGQALGAAQFNASTQNEQTLYNNQLKNSANLSNLSATNQYNQALDNSAYIAQQAQAKAWMQMGSSITGLAGGMGGGGSGLGSLGSSLGGLFNGGLQSSGFYGTQQQAVNAGGGAGNGAMAAFQPSGGPGGSQGWYISGYN